MSETLSAFTEDTTSKKRGRKSVKENYFDVREETAVKKFLLAKTSEEKNKIYNEFKNKKAYSYFGTICKNYLMGQIIKDQKETNRKVSYEDISSTIEERPDMIYRIDEEVMDTNLILQGYLDELQNFINNEPLNDNEKKLGFALIDLFNNYESIFTGAENNKFNKNVILLSLREMTNLSTKEIRGSIKKFKKLYLTIQVRLKNQ